MSLIRPVTGPISQAFDGTFSWEPAGYLRRVFPLRGARFKFISSALYYPHIHLAIDYVCPVGTPVKAVKSGILIWQGKDITGANVVYLRVRRGAKFDVTAIYYHLSAFKYTVGSLVPSGATVALSGATGNVTGPHLHAELVRTSRGTAVTDIYRKGIRFDPQPLIDGTVTLAEIAP